MFPNTSALRVIQYTPKVPGSITHKLPVKPSWSKSGKEPVKPLAAPKKTPKDTEGEKRRTTVGGLMVQSNALFDVKTAEGVFNLITSPTPKPQVFLTHYRRNHSNRGRQALTADRPQESTPGSNSGTDAECV
jgi:hypothetical protein